MKLLDYLDISTADMHTLKTKRERLNTRAFLMELCYVFFVTVSVFSILLGTLFIGFAAFLAAIIFLTLTIGIVLKREIWSIMIYLKRRE